MKKTILLKDEEKIVKGEGGEISTKEEDLSR
jgi:hypothetical protein